MTASSSCQAAARPAIITARARCGAARLRESSARCVRASRSAGRARSASRRSASARSPNAGGSVRVAALGARFAALLSPQYWGAGGALLRRQRRSSLANPLHYRWEVSKDLFVTEAYHVAAVFLERLGSDFVILLLL